VNPANVTSVREPFKPNGVAPETPVTPAPARNPPASPVDIVERWGREGPLVRVQTGISALDRACRGGLPIPWRILIIGAPSAGKTFVAVAIADVLARVLADAGLCVGILGVDEEPEDLTVRLAQIAGFGVEEAERRDHEVLRHMAKALAAARILLYDATHTIESAAADLAVWAKAEKRLAALFIDSIQAARSDAALSADSPREIVEANVAAMRVASTGHRMLVGATSEANRASYRNEQAAEQSNDLAAGAESRAIEFGAQTLLMLRTPKDRPDVIHVRIAKNRRAYVGEFWLKLDRERHALTECPAPSEDPNATTRKTEANRRAAVADVERDAKAIAVVVRSHPGIGERDLRAALRTAGHRWGRERVDAAKRRLKAGLGRERLVDRSEAGRACSWYVEASEAAPGRSGENG
jgi:KaiC/GvpD/RAD55 family RecA-like ATPase